MILPREEWHLDTKHLGRRVLVFDCVDSTNTRAAALAEDRANDGLVVLAEEQTAGRGQHGRTWCCQRGVGVLLSVLLFPPPALRRPVILAAWSANAVCNTIHQSVGLQAKIKWPNDVLVRKRKVCGILIEQGLGTVVGIGLNLNQTAESFRAAQLPQAGSLAVFTGRSFECHDVARLLIRHLDEAYQCLCAGDLNALQTRWKQRIGLVGKQVRVECHDAVYRGQLRELMWSGLDLKQATGEMIRLPPESVRHLTLDEDEA
jgi:BirA family biotin operon repressor/biotin-[acetyl-CoA-carboxylase] ligase